MSVVTITVYLYTGKHLGGLINIAEEKCLECNMNATAAREVQKELGEERVKVELKSYSSNLHRAILKGIFHPPATLVNGKYIYGGDDIPDLSRLKEEVLKALGEAPTEHATSVSTSAEG